MCRYFAFLYSCCEGTQCLFWPFKNLIHCTPWRHLGREEVAPTHSPPRHWMGWVVRITPRQRFTPWERTPDTHCRGGWVGTIAGLDTEARGKSFHLCRWSNLDRPVVQHVPRHYTAWATRLIWPLNSAGFHRGRVCCFYWRRKSWAWFGSFSSLKYLWRLPN
jgi:hypothetical protein